MNHVQTSMLQVECSMCRLQRRDRAVLLGYAFASVVVVGLGEWAALYLGVVVRYGSYPILIRAAVYILGTTVMWAVILRFDRQRVRTLMERHLRDYDAILLAYDSALGLKNPYTGGHGRRVAFYAGHLAENLGLDALEAEQVRQAALLHDVGKIGIPDAILNKPDVLTAEEFDQMRHHATLGAGVVEGIASLTRLAPAIRHHHEHYDGSGYPNGLRGKDIPLAARIIAVADALDAMTTDRPYNKAVTLEAAVAEITRSAGSNFDPQVVALLIDDHFLDQLKQAREQGFSAVAAVPGYCPILIPVRRLDAIKGVVA